MPVAMACVVRQHGVIYTNMNTLISQRFALCRVLL